MKKRTYELYDHKLSAFNYLIDLKEQQAIRNANKLRCSRFTVIELKLATKDLRERKREFIDLYE